MQAWQVEYCQPDGIYTLTFVCMADDKEHAREQFADAEPLGTILSMREHEPPAADYMRCAGCGDDIRIDMIDAVLDEDGNDTGVFKCESCYPPRIGSGIGWCPESYVKAQITDPPHRIKRRSSVRWRPGRYIMRGKWRRMNRMFWPLRWQLKNSRPRRINR